MSVASFICDADRAVEFGKVTGTQRTELLGLSPTGRPIEYYAGRLFAFREGLIAYERRFYDFRGVLDRLEKLRTDQDLALAGEVQRTLLPRTTYRNGHVEVVCASRACRTIGGDFIECVDLPAGGLGVGLGDVSGKGPAAALVATMLQGMLSIVADLDVGPAAVLSHLNRGLCRRDMSPRFATMMYGVFARDGRFVYSNAGHNPPIHLTAAASRWLTTGGTLLGVFDPSTFAEETVVLSPGDTIIAFSDGVTDAARRDGEPFGAERLEAEAYAHRAAAPAALMAALFAAIDRFIDGAPLPDDATMFVARLR
jgi:sigma-B regulation protein RsbU (phosphoserine phosphatase)